MRQVVSVDIDGTIALALETLCAAVNAKCGTQYTMFDISDQGWHHAFEDDPEAQEWAQTFLDYAYGSHMATIGFYKAMAPDIGGIAAVNMLHKAGVHVIISTLRDVHMYSVTKWWLDHWGVQYDELNCSPNSKFVLAAQGPMVFVDDSLKVAVNLVAQGSICYLLSRPLEPTVPKDVRLVDTWAPILDYFGVALDATQVPQLAAPIFTAAVKKDETVNITKHYSEAQGDGSDSQAAGIAVVSQGSGRVLMIQRDNTDKDKKAASRLEFPGGRLDANESAWAGALREWQEETGNELPEGEIVATWDNDHGPYRLFVYVIATESEIHLNPDKDDMEVVDPDHPHASQPEVAAWYYPKDLATAKKMVRKELRKFDWSVLTDAVDGKERPKMMVFDLLKGFGDPGSTQERETNGEFGPGTGASDSTAASVGATFDALLTENNALTQEATVHALSQANSGMPSGKDLYTSAQGGGFSHNADGSVPTTGFQVGGQTEPLTLSDNMDPQEAGAQIEAYQQANADILSQDRMAIGGWNDGKGNVVIEPSVNVADRQEATDLGEANNQESVHDNVTREDIPTGGTGEYTGMSVDPVMARLMAQSSTMSMALDLLIKGFGDPNSTQDREPNGQFGEGSGASAESERSASDSKLEEVAIDNFGAAVEMQGQQFVTPNGTILDLPQGDGHDSIVQVTGGSVNTATSRAIDAGFARTSLDIANSSGELGLVMEFSRPLTDPQIGAVITAAKDNELSYFAIDVPPITSGGYDRARGLSDSTLLYSGEKESPTLSGIAGMIRDANVAAGGTRKSAAYIKMLLKSFGDPGNTQDRVEHGEFGAGSGELKDPSSTSVAGVTAAHAGMMAGAIATMQTQGLVDKSLDPKSAEARSAAVQVLADRGLADLQRSQTTLCTNGMYQGMTAEAAGRVWYNDTNAIVAGMAEQLGVPVVTAAAAVSICSAQCTWQNTKTAAGNAEPDYPNLQNAYGAIVTGLTSDASPRDAAKATYGQAPFQWQAIGMVQETFATGARPAATIASEVVTGPKRGSFASNIADPTNPRPDGNVTIDRQMIAAMYPENGGNDINEAQYALIADGTRAAAAAFNATPGNAPMSGMQAQAAIWMMYAMGSSDVRH
jgi:8-oxo-dGTP pyrophosphatase MutT (NUDIX family)